MAKFKSKTKIPKKVTFSQAFKEGFREVRQFEWDRFQFQFPPALRLKKGVKARNFASREDAEKFKRIAKKKGFKHFLIRKEIAEFFGAVCTKPQLIFMVYFSKKPFKLEVDDPTRISLAKSKLLSPTPAVCSPREFQHNFKVIGGATT